MKTFEVGQSCAGPGLLSPRLNPLAAARLFVLAMCGVLPACARFDSPRESLGRGVYRIEVHGGWVVESRYGMVFVPDPDHEWKK
jgi:hypothetical protein